jgi:hypothetical protein
MWVRKSEEEIRRYLDEQEANRLSLLRPALFALILTVIAMALYALGYRGGWLRGGVVLVSASPVPLGISTILGAAFLFLLFFGMSLYNQRRRTSFFSSNDSLLCGDCKQPSHSDPSATCECGGKLSPLRSLTG